MTEEDRQRYINKMLEEPKNRRKNKQKEQYPKTKSEHLTD